MIPLDAAALALLKQARDKRDGGRFSERGSTYARSGHLWREVCKRLASQTFTSTTSVIASRLLELGERETNINKTLGHSKLRMTTRYMHSSEESRRRAVESLPQICHKEEAKVLNFKAK